MGKHEASKCKNPKRRKILRHALFILSVVLIAHFIAHFSWEAFHTLWVHQLHLPDPAQLGDAFASSAASPIIIAALAAIAWLTELLP